MSKLVPAFLLALAFASNASAQTPVSPATSQNGGGQTGIPDRGNPVLTPGDPSTATTFQLDRSILGLRTEMLVRQDAMDKAVSVALETVNRFPTLLDREIGALKVLMDKQSIINDEKNMVNQESLKVLEKELGGRITTLTTQFDERTKASSTAIAAAFQSSGAAIDKSTSATVDAIAQLRTLSQEQIRSLTAIVDEQNRSNAQQISVINSRLDKTEGNKSGSTDSYAWIIAVAGLAFGGITLIFMLIDRRHTSTTTVHNT